MGIRHRTRAEGHSDRRGERGIATKGRDEHHSDNNQHTQKSILSLILHRAHVPVGNASTTL